MYAEIEDKVARVEIAVSRIAVVGHLGHFGTAEVSILEEEERCWGTAALLHTAVVCKFEDTDRAGWQFGIAAAAAARNAVSKVEHSAADLAGEHFGIAAAPRTGVGKVARSGTACRHIEASMDFVAVRLGTAAALHIEASTSAEHLAGILALHISVGQGECSGTAARCILLVVWGRFDTLCLLPSIEKGPAWRSLGLPPRIFVFRL